MSDPDSDPGSDSEGGTDGDDQGGVEATKETLEALCRSYALKDERRTGWQLRAVDEPESVAAHTWGVSLLVLCFCPAALDRERALSLAAVHDVPEAVVGDIPTRAEESAKAVDPTEKRERERTALIGPLAGLGDEIRELWGAYDRRDTPEARFVKDMDLLDTCLQALVYEREGRYDPEADNPHFEAYDHLDEFFATTEPRLETDIGRTLYDAVERQYEDAKQER